jgi:hypothetical protein
MNQCFRLQTGLEGLSGLREIHNMERKKKSFKKTPYQMKRCKGSCMIRQKMAGILEW